MSQTLKQGENTALNSAKGKVTVHHIADNRIDVNLTAFLLTEAGKVVDDSGMVFFNTPAHQSGAATYIPPITSGNELKHSIDFDLSRLPQHIARVAITLTQDGTGTGFAAVQGLSAKIEVDGQVVELAPSGFDRESGIIALELYTRNGRTKARSVWQGFESGLAGLCQMYGVEVEEDSAPAPAPAPKIDITKTVVSLSKPSDMHKISLAKGPSSPEFIKVSATWVDNNDGLDNDDLDLRIGILRPNGQMSIIQAPERAGSFDQAPYVLHQGDVITASVKEPATETVHINPRISHLLGGKVALVCSVYSALANGAVSAVTVKVSVALFDFYAAIFSTSLTTRRSGFSDTNVTGCQLRVSPLQRSGCAALAARLSACLLANMALSSPVWRCIGVTKRIALWRCS